MESLTPTVSLGQKTQAFPPGCLPDGKKRRPPGLSRTPGTFVPLPGWRVVAQIELLLSSEDIFGGKIAGYQLLLKNPTPYGWLGRSLRGRH